MSVRLLAIVLLTTTALQSAASGQGVLHPAEGYVIIPWEKTPEFTGRRAVVYGRIVAAKNVGYRCYLNFDEDWRHHLTVSINGSHFERFPGPPEKLYEKKNVVVVGYVQGELAKPEMYVSSPEHILIGPDDTAELAAFARAKFPHARTVEQLPARRQRSKSGAVTMGTYNILNLFDGFDDPYRADEVMSTKPREQLERVAERIRKLDADVLALQEVENRFYLSRFVEVFLPDMGYEHIVLLEANNHRGIDCAVLSRFPVGPVTSYQHMRFKGPDGKTYPFQRDLLQARIEGPEGLHFDVLCVHLKSKYGGAEASEAPRQAEAGQIRRIVDDILAADPKARFVIAGDFNDVWDSASLKIIRGSGAGELGCPAQDLSAAQQITYNKEPHRSMIDFILMSPAMRQRFDAGSYRIIHGSVDDSGSDHNPVVATFKTR